MGRNTIMARLAALLLVLASSATVAELRVIDRQGSPVPNAVIKLDAHAPNLKPTKTHIIDQIDKHFVPFVSVVPVGTAIHFPNSDDIRHHVYSFSDAKTFELKLYHANDADPITFDRPGLITLGCNIHDTMKAYVWVVDEAAAVTDAQGVVTSVGDERPLMLWHPQMPEWQPATITNGAIVLPMVWDPLDPQAPRERDALEERMRRFKRHAD